MKKNLSLYGFAAFALIASSSASATLLDYSYTNLGVTGGEVYNSVSMTVDGIAVDVTAYTIENNGAGLISSMAQITGTGLGVYVSSSASGNLGVLSSSSGDGTNMDGGGSASDPDEGLLFTFSEAVSLSYINFDSFGSGDDFNLTVDGVTLLWDFNDSDLPNPLVPGSPDNDEFLFSGISGTEFLFWVDSDSDSMRIDRMRVDRVSVSEPATLALMGLGLAWLGFRKKRQA